MKKILVYLLALLIFISPVMVNAEIVTVTKENLSSALEDLKIWVNSSDENSSENIITNSQIISYEVSENAIEIETNESVYSFYYRIDSDGKVVFVNSQTFTNNMQYDDYKKKSEDLQTVLLGYLLVAYIEGASFDDAAEYYMLNYINFAFETLANQNSDVPFVIIETSDNPDVSVEVPESMEINGKNVPVITEDEFPSRSLEYAVYSYSSLLNFKDNNEGYLDSFENQVNYSSKTDTLITVDSTLTVDSTKDYTQLKSINEKLQSDLEGSLEDMFGNLDNNSNEQVENIEPEVESTPTPIQPETPKEEIQNPETGISIPLVSLLVGISFIIVIKKFTKKRKFYKI